MLEMFNHPDEIMPLVEATDYKGKDIFYYLDEYDMYSILDCRIIDRVINKKWNGKYNINSSPLDDSISYAILQNEYDVFSTDHIFKEIRIKLF